MLYLGNGVYFDTKDMIAFRLNGDGKRPSILFNGTDDDTSLIEEFCGVKVSVR